MGQPVIFSRIAQLSVEYKIIEAKQATDLETAAKRLAARPVGAHNKRFMCFAEKIRRIELTVVVLPTPARR
jgi:hypothetical protein